MTGERRWFHFYGESVSAAFGAPMARVLALYDTGWYVFVNVKLVNDDMEMVGILETGRYDEAEGRLSLSMTEHEGEPFPPGPPFVVSLDGDGTFLFGDMAFVTEEHLRS